MTVFFLLYEITMYNTADSDWLLWHSTAILPAAAEWSVPDPETPPLPPKSDQSMCLTAWPNRRLPSPRSLANRSVSLPKPEGSVTGTWPPGNVWRAPIIWSRTFERSSPASTLKTRASPAKASSTSVKRAGSLDASGVFLSDSNAWRGTLHFNISNLSAKFCHTNVVRIWQLQT